MNEPHQRKEKLAKQPVHLQDKGETRRRKEGPSKRREQKKRKCRMLVRMNYREKGNKRTCEVGSGRFWEIEINLRRKARRK